MGPSSSATPSIRLGESQGQRVKLLALYLLGAYAWTWGIGFSAVAIQKTHPHCFANAAVLWTVLGIAAFGPTLSAFAVSGWVLGRENGPNALLRRCHPSLIPRAWLLFACFSMPVRCHLLTPVNATHASNFSFLGLRCCHGRSSWRLRVGFMCGLGARRRLARAPWPSW
jgi:hypothetical protein